MNRPVIAVFAVVISASFLLSATTGYAQTTETERLGVQSEVETISRARFKALVARDAAYLKQNYTSDFKVVGEDGKLMGIGFLEWVVKNAPKDVNFEPFAYRVMISNDGSQAVAYHKTHDTWGGEHSDVSYTEVFVKQDGRWLLAFEQYGEIREH